jgi:hypothetical protein
MVSARKNFMTEALKAKEEIENGKGLFCIGACQKMEI